MDNYTIVQSIIYINANVLTNGGVTPLVQPPKNSKRTCCFILENTFVGKEFKHSGINKTL